MGDSKGVDPEQRADAAGPETVVHWDASRLRPSRLCANIPASPTPAAGAHRSHTPDPSPEARLERPAIHMPLRKDEAPWPTK